MDCSLPGSSVHEIFQARVLAWVTIIFFKATVHRVTKSRTGLGDFAFAFEFFYQWDLFCKPVGGCLPPRHQGIVEVTLSLDCYPIGFLSGDCTTSIHLEGLLRGRVNRWLSPLKQWVFRGGKGHLCPQFRQQVSS